MDMLGVAERVAVTKERTTMISTGKHEAEVAERIKKIKVEKEETDSEFDREKCEERIAKLGGAIGRIKVGAATETELKDKKLRYEDALNSVKSAMNDGIVPGGGSTLVYLLRTKDKLTSQIEDEDEKLAVDILYRAMTYPIIQIAENASWFIMASTLSDNTAPSASLDHLEAQAAPTQPRAQPEPLGSLPWPQELASGRPKVEEFPLSTTRYFMDAERNRRSMRVVDPSPPTSPPTSLPPPPDLAPTSPRSPRPSAPGPLLTSPSIRWSTT